MLTSEFDTIDRCLDYGSENPKSNAFLYPFLIFFKLFSLLHSSLLHPLVFFPLVGVYTSTLPEISGYCYFVYHI